MTLGENNLCFYEQHKNIETNKISFHEFSKTSESVFKFVFFRRNLLYYYITLLFLCFPICFVFFIGGYRTQKWQFQQLNGRMAESG